MPIDIAPRRHRATVALVVCAAATVALAVVIHAVRRGGRLSLWDQAADNWLHAHETPIGDRLFILVSLLGLPVAWIIGVVVGLLLLWRRRWLVLGGWVAALGGGGILERLLKVAVDRARPPYASAFLHGQSASFPSGHAMAACLCYVMLVYVTTQLVTLDRRRVMMLSLAASLLIAAVSFSRLYLAVHYPSNVAGALLASVAWLALCMAALEGIKS